jgi:hypothetical protein
MQLHLQLVTFEYEQKQPFRTVNIDGDPWFYAIDVCAALGIANARDSVSKLDEDDVATTDGVDSLGRKSKINIVNESGLYNLTFQSRKEEAKKFKRWITREVIPQIRKGGSYVLPGVKPQGLPIFVRRFNENWDRVDTGHFSVISELFIRVYGKFEQAGHKIADRGPDGKELRPDVSVGITFPKWLKEAYPHLQKEFKTYRHLLPNGTEVDARQYKTSVLPAFIEFVETVWLTEHAYSYLESRDVVALQYLPKLLPPPSKLG